ncbi:CHRD domain-containing protein [Brachybacterium alimentarium]|uniref:CHRD domain-containing protein n=1 Tax=Brachybacterium alimentarium TaxID=47845 RepID=UPI00216305F7|nr:CHRD domain-containing protein [Brachybacterium alimentarium]
MMRTTTKRVLPLLAATAMLGLFGGSSAALAEGHGGHDMTTLEAHLTELNDSGASGTAWVTLDGNEVTVKMENTGLLAGSPHAQHIHVGGKNQCPDPNMEGNGENGAIQVSDAHDDYGMIVSSLTTEGDTSPDSGLAVDRFPVGDDAYERTFEVSDDVAADIADGKGVIVVHGVDHNGSGEYDGDVVSDLDPNLPSEATDPAACGTLDVAQMEQWPEGGAETGDGSTAGIENSGALIAGGGLLTAAAVGGIALRRRQTQK